MAQYVYTGISLLLINTITWVMQANRKLGYKRMTVGNECKLVPTDVDTSLLAQALREV